mmetsp:Transcript_62050/g.146302  ORF Transcript_62050/g.146302 Transcript_62050/m.146302 type:complete len:742 (+) Transcript_62050:56-2281(+)
MAETSPLQDPTQDEHRMPIYGSTGNTVNGRATKRSRGPSAQCLLLSSVVVTGMLFGALYCLPGEPVAAQTHLHRAADAVTKVFSTAKGSSQLKLTKNELDGLPVDVRSALNAEVDPCEDFYEFSCGGWDKVTSIPAWQSSWARQWDGVTTRVEHLTYKALEKDHGPGGRFFRSCMDTDTIQTLGAKPLKPWLDAVELIKDHATLMQALARFAIADMNAFFSWWVDADSQDSSVNSFFVAQGGITMPDQTYYTEQTDAMARHRKAYTTMIVNIMKLAGRTQTEAEADSSNVMEVETAIARAMTSETAERDEHGKRATIEELAEILPTMDWKGWFTMLGTPALGSHKTGYLVVKNEAFLRKLDGIMKNVGLDRIRSYMRWQAAYNYAPFLSFPFEDELVAYNKDIYGISHLPPRWRKCFFSTGESMDMVVSKLFVDAAFPESARRAALEMLYEIRDQFNQTLQTKDWMDAPARAAAVHKLEHMFLEVGHPTTWPKSTFETFEEFGGIQDKRYFDNIVATNAFDVTNTLARLGKPVDRRRWGSSSATDVNSYYSRKVNGIFIPAGILQPPFYSQTQAVARNYGSVGAICGHEMTHGFDDVGREYDADGNRKGWWSPEVVSKFKERAACIADLFSSYQLFGRHVNGKLTLGEAIADSGGLKFSWESFVAKHSPSPEDRKLFFIAMGQTWCDKEKRVGARAALLTDQHPPAKFRVIGTLSQFPEFAETFQCPVGSAMNPEKRCHLW